MILVERLKKADILPEKLEDLIAEYMLVMNVEENLKEQGHDNLLIAFLKLQQDCGVQIDLTKKLKGTNTTLGNGEPPPLRYGIDLGATPPGEHTQRTYINYEAVTFARVTSILREIHAVLSDPVLKKEFEEMVKKIGIFEQPPAPLSATLPQFTPTGP